MYNPVIQLNCQDDIYFIMTVKNVKATSVSWMAPCWTFAFFWKGRSEGKVRPGHEMALFVC